MLAQFQSPFLNLREGNVVRTLACSVVVLLVAGGCGSAGADEPAAGPNPEQQAAPQEHATATEPAAAQATIARSGPEPAPAVAPFDAEQAKRHQEAWAKYLGVPVTTTNSIGMKLALIPPGEFMMGSAESAEETARAFEREGAQAAWFQDEHPQHRVRLTKSSCLSVHEVTQEQYERVMETNPSHVKGPQHPVEIVSWDDTVRFCDKLSALAEEKAAGRVYRLPTEAEWEYACRAGSTTRYSSGNDAAGLKDYGWFMENSSGTTHPVGEKQPNAWGLYDMEGNVSEWCGGLVPRRLLCQVSRG